MDTPYSQYVKSIVTQYVKLSGYSSTLLQLVKPTSLSAQPRVLILSPHPDDECLMAGYALRMQEEWGASVTVVPYSYGSRQDRRSARFQELQDALGVLRFDFHDPRKAGTLDRLTDDEFEAALKKLRPEIIISPHARDLHPTHVAAHDLVARTREKTFWLQTEYWMANPQPNLFIPLSPSHVVQIGEALMKHRGEVSRNPYHLSLPAWYMDQARRAQEILPAFGSSGQHIMFGQLFQIG